MKQLLTLILLLNLLIAQAQTEEKFNLGFENHDKNESLSDGWFEWGNYELSIEKLSHSGEHAGKITSDQSGSSFGSIAYKIPANYKGNTIQLKGFMKIENVENGFAGLLMRIDGNGTTLGFTIQMEKKLKG